MNPSETPRSKYFHQLNVSIFFALYFLFYRQLYTIFTTSIWEPYVSRFTERKNIQIRNFLWSEFSHFQTEYSKSPYLVQKRQNTGPGKRTYLDTFYTVFGNNKIMPKNRSHVSGNRQGKVFFLSLTRPHSRTCIRIYIFN